MGESGGMEIESEREILSIVGELKAPGPDGTCWHYFTKSTGILLVNRLQRRLVPFSMEVRCE